jgi:hypothetical protein
MNTVLLKKLFTSKEKTPVGWYSHQCVPASHHSRCISTANKIALRCSATHSYALPSFHFLSSSSSRKKTPKPWRTRGKHHARRTASYQKSEPSESNLLFPFFSLDPDCNLMIHLSLISVSTCYRRIFSALSNSSAKEEDAMHE